MKRVLVPSAFVLFLLHAERNALASPSFPAVVQEVTNAPAVPACTLCHTSPSGGSGTANTPFAKYLKTRGLRPGDTDSLRGALQAMIGERHDTDGDGTTDADELKAGGDPNGDVDTSVDPIGYGCGGARIASRPVSADATWIALLLVALGLRALVRTSHGRYRHGRDRA